MVLIKIQHLALVQHVQLPYVVHIVQVLARSLVGWNSLGAESWHGSLV